MPSRGVVPGDLMRADDAWNGRIRAALEPLGVGPGEDGTIEAETSNMLHSDLWAESDTMVWREHVRTYFGVTEVESSFFQLAYGAVAHAGAIGALAERQRWGDDAGYSVREAVLESVFARVREDLAKAAGALEEGESRFAGDAIVSALARIATVIG